MSRANSPEGKALSTEWGFDIGRAAETMAAIANPKRLQVLGLLADGEWKVGDLSKEVDLAQSALSQHLHRLRLAGLVQHRRQGQEVYYTTKAQVVIRILRILEEIERGPC